MLFYSKPISGLYNIQITEQIALTGFIGEQWGIYKGAIGDVEGSYKGGIGEVLGRYKFVSFENYLNVC